MNGDEAVELFVDAGFENVVKEDAKELPSDQTNDLGLVKHVAVDGMESFAEGDVVRADKKIVVTVYAIEEEPDSEFSEEAGSAEEPTQEVLTIDNSSDLASLFSQGSTNADWFASAYKNREIAFDGYIASIMNHGAYDTRYDVLILAGDAGASPSLGPNLKFTDVNTFDMGIEDLFLPGYMSDGSNVRVTAIVKSYSSTQDVLELDPVLVEAR